MSDNNKDGFYGIITGTVERVRPYSRGQVVTVAVLLNPNNKYPDRITVWSGDEQVPAEGSRVKVSGQISWKAELYNDKPRAQVSVNFPKWETLEAAQSAPVQSAGDSWNAPGTYSDEVPF